MTHFSYVAYVDPFLIMPFIFRGSNDSWTDPKGHQGHGKSVHIVRRILGRKVWGKHKMASSIDEIKNAQISYPRRWNYTVIYSFLHMHMDISLNICTYFSDTLYQCTNTDTICNLHLLTVDDIRLCLSVFQYVVATTLIKNALMQSILKANWSGLVLSLR